MVSLCRHYINLQKIYQAKAEADFLVMEERVKNILKKTGRDPSSISKPTIKSFCKNARKLKVRILNFLEILIWILMSMSTYCLFNHSFEAVSETYVLSKI